MHNTTSGSNIRTVVAGAGARATLGVPSGDAGESEAGGVSEPHLQASELAPGLLLGEGVKIGAGVTLGGHVVIHARARIGERARIGDHAQIRKRAEIGARATVGSFVSVDPEVTVGARASVQTRCYLAHGTVVEDDAFLGPGVTIANDDTMGRHDV